MDKKTKNFKDKPLYFSNTQNYSSELTDKQLKTCVGGNGYYNVNYYFDDEYGGIILVTHEDKNATLLCRTLDQLGAAWGTW